MFLNSTGPVPTAGVAGIGTDTPSEEALACFTAQNAKVVSRGSVSTDLAEGML